jgi:ABC-type glycerol-3-phosphate transport system substrate-binding protein
LTRSRFSRRAFVGGGLTIAASALLACTQAAPPTAAPASSAASTKPAAAPTTAPAAAANPAPTTAAPAPATKPATGAKAIELKYLWVTRPGEETLWKETYPQVLSKYHPNITPAIETVPASGDYWGTLLTKIVAMTAAGSPPDVSRNAGFNAKQLEKSGLFRNIMDYTKSESYPFDQHFTAAFPPHIKTADGKLNGLPVSILTVVRYVNKDLLKKAGLTAPNNWDKGNWTQQQAFEYALKLSTGEGTDRTYGMHMLANTMHGSHWFWANGAEIIDPKGEVKVTEQAAIDTFAFALEFYKQRVSPTPTDLQTVPLATMFNTGRIAMMDFSQSTVPVVAKGAKFDWGVMPTAIGKSGKSFAVQFVDFWYVHNKAANPEAGYQAIEVLNREEFETAMAVNKTGGIPTLKGVAEKFAKDLLTNDADVSLTSLDHSREPYYAVNHGQWQDLVTKKTDLLWLGKLTPKECAEQIATEAKAILAADKA